MDSSPLDSAISTKNTKQKKRCSESIPFWGYFVIGAFLLGIIATYLSISGKLAEIRKSAAKLSGSATEMMKAENPPAKRPDPGNEISVAGALISSNSVLLFFEGKDLFEGKTRNRDKAEIFQSISKLIRNSEELAERVHKIPSVSGDLVEAKRLLVEMQISLNVMTNSFRFSQIDKNSITLEESKLEGFYNAYKSIELNSTRIHLMIP